MIAVLMLSASSTDLSAAEQHRIMVYVLAAIVGLLVTGAIACAKVARRRRTVRPIGRLPGHPSSR